MLNGTKLAGLDLYNSSQKWLAKSAMNCLSTVAGGGETEIGGGAVELGCCWAFGMELMVFCLPAVLVMALALLFL